MSLAFDILQNRNCSVSESWGIRRIGDLVELTNGFPFPSDSFGPTGDLPLVRIRDLATSSFGTFVTGDIPKNSIVRNGDVVIGMDGDFNLVVWDRGRAALNQRMCLLRPRAGIDIRFIAYALPGLLSIINDLTFATTVKHLSSNDILSERILLPNLEEQRRIADFLDAETSRIDRLAARSSGLRTTLLERRRSLVSYAVAGDLHESRHSSSTPWLETIPAHWDEIRLGLVAQMGSGHTPSRNRPEWWKDCSIPWVTTGEVRQVRDDRLEVLTDTREKISEIGLANSAAELHNAGTVFLCRTAASAGYSGIMGSDMATSQDIVTWLCGPRLDNYYLLWCLRAMRTDLLERLAMGSTHKTIYMPDLQMLRIPLPPVSEQRDIVGRIQNHNTIIDKAVDAISGQIELLAERRHSLITAAVTGQFDVTTASGRTLTQEVGDAG